MRYVDAVLCAVFVLLAEWLVVALGAWGQFAGGFEVARTFVTVLPLGVVTALPVAVGGAICIHATADGSRWGKWWLATPALLLAGLTAFGVSTGRHFAAHGRREAFVVVVALAAGGAAFGLQPWLRRGLVRLSARGRAYLWPTVFALVVALEAVNALVLPRLYPAFHLGLAVLTLWTAALGARGWAIDSARRARIGLAVLLSVGCVALAWRAPSTMRFFDNARFVFVERAPLLRYGLRVAALVSPPPPLDDSGIGPSAPEGAPRIDISGRDVVLISIDAVRADHVGAYGYERDTTPAIDALAKDGVVFEHAYTATPHTSYAVTSMMTGKYMRPLLLQGVGEDSETWAGALRRYGYQTAAFFPPAVFFIDPERFRSFEERGLDFEYRKVQFSGAQERAREVGAYLTQLDGRRPLFLWVHLFEPHEPYEAHREHPFGDRAIDRYDAEIAAADAGVGQIVAAVRAKRPRAVVVVTSDHGEEFGDHGGRYHGTTVYEEQVRVPLIVHAPGVLTPRRVSQPVSLVDLMPTVLGGVGMPRSPRIRGRDRSPLMVGEGGADRGLAFAETDSQTLLAEGSLRLICARRVDACRLYDVAEDPAQARDVAAAHVEAFASMKRRSAQLVASMGRYEGTAEGDWPRALRRGIAGDAAAAVDVASLLDDVDVRIRRKAAEVLFELQVKATAPHLRRALRNEEDPETKRWAALALTRLGQGAGLAYDLLNAPEPQWRRLAALALAEAGDNRGEGILIGWWRAAYPEESRDAKEKIPFARARQVVHALGQIRSEDAVLPLTYALRDVRLRVHVARALAVIGEKAARPSLAKALEDERYHHARVAMAQALVELGGKYELRDPLVRFLGVPDPMPGGLGFAMASEMLPFVGGPRDTELKRLREFATSGVVVGISVPKSEHRTGEGVRVVIRARASGEPGEVRIGPAGAPLGDGRRRQRVPKRSMKLDPASSVTVAIPVSDELREHVATFPAEAAARLKGGDYADMVVYATQSVELSAFAVLPLTREVPPPAPEPWSPKQDE